MFENFLLKYTKTKNSGGLYISINDEGEKLCHFVLLTSAKGKIEIKKRFSGTFGELLNDVPDIKNIALNISVRGRGVILKKIDAEANSDNSHLLNLAFPNAQNPDDFILQKEIVNDSEVYVGIIRKSLFNEIIESVEKKEAIITNFEIGPFSIKNILPFLNETNEKIETENESLIIKNGQLSEIVNSENNHGAEVTQLFDEAIENKYLLPYSLAINLFLNKISTITPITSEIQEQQTEFAYKYFFSKAKLILPGLLFIILFVNFLFFSNFSNEYNSVNYEYNANKELLDKLESLQKENAKQEAFLDYLNINAIERLSYFADRIAITLPQKIKLTQLNLNPLQKKINSEKEIGFVRPNIQITGNSPNDAEVYNWGKTLKNEKWVDDVSLNYFKQANNSKIGEFSLKIKYKPN